ncbi:MAG: RIP metalloprotease RseP [Peptostreptococcaceae bacterium]
MTIIAAIILFGIIVFIHELGHFLLAKRAGIRIHEFAVGMGPKLFATKKGDTLYSLRLLPIGGYCAMEGEDGESNDPKSFGRKSILQRASVLFAGPFFNIVFAVVLLIPVFIYMGSPSTILGQIIPNSPAQSVGLKVEDKIIDINGNKINSWEDVITSLHSSKGEEVKITVDRDKETKVFKVTPEKNEQGNYVIGIAYKPNKNFFTAIGSAFTTTVDMTKQMIQFFGQLFTGTVPGGVENAVTGPVGVISIVSDQASKGIFNLMYIGAVISLNLGILNLLPIPALDGGRLVMLAIEGIRGGKKLDPNKEAAIHMVGFALLMGFMVFITYKDIVRLF